jgi:hypothetical protein
MIRGSALLEDTALLPRGRHFSERANQNVSGYNFDTVNGELDDETIDLRTAMREVQPLKERPIPDAIRFVMHCVGEWMRGFVFQFCRCLLQCDGYFCVGHVRIVRQGGCVVRSPSSAAIK